MVGYGFAFCLHSLSIFFSFCIVLFCFVLDTAGDCFNTFLALHLDVESAPELHV